MVGLKAVLVMRNKSNYFDSFVNVLISIEEADKIVQDLVTFLRHDNKNSITFGISQVFNKNFFEYNSYFFYEVYVYAAKWDEKWKSKKRHALFTASVQIPKKYLFNRDLVLRELSIQLDSSVTNEKLASMDIYKNLYNGIIELSLEKFHD